MAATPPRTAIVIEDDGVIAEDLSATLESLGLLVCGIATGSTEAMKLYTDSGADLITMDVSLDGGREGLAAAAAMRAMIDTPIVFVTGRTDPDTRERIMSLPGTAIAPKPYSIVELRAAIDQACARVKPLPRRTAAA